MKIFSCDQCGQPVFFENVQCLHCGCRLAFLPDELSLASIVSMTADADQNDPATLWQRTQAAEPAPLYRLCHNHVGYQACNFAVPADDSNGLCISCRQTRLLPDLSQPENHRRWYLVENAKRRLYYTLARLGLTARSLTDGPTLPAPTYDFLADQAGAAPVMTGHQNGLITLNIAEADDDERARRRVQLHEPYRTLLGHLRHESGHFYWDLLIRDGGRQMAFREVFGDESIDYGQALQAHYAATDTHNAWAANFVSAYAAAHPWEDWAETWAHYLHMVDLLETAASYQTRLVIPGGHTQQPRGPDNPFDQDDTEFDSWIQQWVPVTLLLNSLNRSLGQNDAYPFALSEGALRKLRYVHDVIRQATCKAPEDSNGQPQAAPAMQMQMQMAAPA